ncbi:S1 motif domain-containing protein [Plasmodiophora brassicae]
MSGGDGDVPKGKRAFIDEEAEVSEDEDLDFKASEDEEESEDEDEEAARLNREMIADEEEIDAEHEAVGRGASKAEAMEDLVEDDYLLLEDHHGVRFNRKKRPREDVRPDGTHRRLQRRIEEQDEEASDIDRDKTDNVFSEDDYGLSDVSDEDVGGISNERAARQKSARSARQFGEAGEIFGDMTEFLAFTEAEEIEVVEDVAQKDRGKQIEPSVAERHMVTAADDAIRAADLPERLQPRVAERVTPDGNDAELVFTEAEWIYELKFKHMDADLAVKSIVTVLDFIRRQSLDVPYIQWYQKDYYAPLKPADIWTIDDCDRRWDHIIAKRVSVSKHLEKNLASDAVDLHSHLMNSQDENEIEDVRSYISFRLTESNVDGASSSVKRPLRRAAPALSQDSSIEPLVQMIFPDPRQIGLNFRSGFLQKEPVDPDMAPEQAAEAFVSDRYASHSAVLSAARSICAMRLAFDPFIRTVVRERFVETAYVSTRPTSKGLATVDWAHEYFSVKRLEDKPARLFREDSAQFALLKRAEAEGFITLQISAAPTGSPHSSASVLLDDFKNLFLSTGFSLNTRLWNEQRCAAFEEAITKYLHKLGETAVHEKLLGASHDLIVDHCADRLRSLVSITPADRDTKVIAACAVGDRGEPSYVAVLDRNGVMVDHLVLPNMKIYARRSDGNGGSSVHGIKSRKAQDVRRFRAFVERYSPTFIAVSADSLDGREFVSEARAAVQSRGREISIEFVDPCFARIAKTSRRLVEELGDFPSLLREAVALGRYAQDPLSEVCGLASDPSDLLSLSLHPLQACVPRALLQSGLSRVLIDLVNHVGVDVNLAATQPHLSGPLSFVSGLGRRKSKVIIDFVKWHGSLTSRDDLHKAVGDCVWRNCIAFLRIVAPQFSQWDVSPLDDSRIHPEHYLLSDRVVLNALDLEANSGGDPRQELIVQLRTPALRYKLDELDLVAYAQAMESAGEGRFTEILLMIRAELKVPFADSMREPFRPLSAESLFCLLTGEQPGVTIYRGQVVDVLISHVTRGGVSAKLDSGLSAFIPLHKFSDKVSICFDEDGERRAYEELLDDAKPGTTVRARISSIDYSRFRVDLTSMERDLKDIEHWEIPPVSDPYLKLFPGDAVALRGETVKAPAPKAVRRFIPRNIDHPLFANVDREAAEAMLKDAPVGDVVIRPSSHGVDKLTITWKVAVDVFAHINVDERDKPQDVRKALGRTLIIDDEAFEDLDEILARYIRPLTKLSETIVQNRAFRFGTETEVDNLLRDEKEEMPARIPYFFGFSYKHPGLFTFSYLPSKRVHHELVKLTPKGFKFHKHFFAKPDQIISYFKSRFSKMIKERGRPPAAAAAAAPPTVPTTSSGRPSRWNVRPPATSAGAAPFIHPQRQAQQQQFVSEAAYPSRRPYAQ